MEENNKKKATAERHEGEIKIEKLKEMKITELSKVAKQLSVNGVSAYGEKFFWAN